MVHFNALKNTINAKISTTFDSKNAHYFGLSLLAYIANSKETAPDLSIFTKQQQKEINKIKNNFNRVDHKEKAKMLSDASNKLDDFLKWGNESENPTQNMTDMLKNAYLFYEAKQQPDDFLNYLYQRKDTNVLFEIYLMFADFTHKEPEENTYKAVIKQYYTDLNEKAVNAFKRQKRNKKKLKRLLKKFCHTIFQKKERLHLIK